jgi:hypothetical protein
MLLPLVLSAPATLVLGSFWASRAMALPFHRLADSRAVLVWWLLVLLILTASGLCSLLARHTRLACGTFGLLLSVLATGLWSGFWFQGSLRLGEEEPAAAWENVVSGPWTAASPIGLQYLGESTEGRALQMLAGGVERQVLPGTSQHYLKNGLVLRITSVLPAPQFVLTDTGGRLLHQGMVKVAPAVENEFFRVGVLPHRFYLSRRDAAAEESVAISMLHLRVQRGKLEVLDLDLVAGEPVTFEGMAFRVEEGATWIEVEVHRSSLPALVAVAAGLIVAAWLLPGAVPGPRRGE